MRERRCNQATDGHLTHSRPADPGEGDLTFQPSDRLLHGRAVGIADLLGHFTRCERPQRRDRLDRGEGEVVAGDRGGALPGGAGDEPGEFAWVLGWPSVLLGEHPGADRGADRSPLVDGDGRVPGQVAVGVVGGELAGHLDLEVRRGGVHVEWPTERTGREGRIAGAGGGNDVGGEPIGVGMPAVSEERLHLRLGDVLAGGQAEALEPGAHPLTW
jgi:hypothetical protein